MNINDTSELLNTLLSQADKKSEKNFTPVLYEH